MLLRGRPCVCHADALCCFFLLYVPQKRFTAITCVIFTLVRVTFRSNPLVFCPLKPLAYCDHDLCKNNRFYSCYFDSLIAPSGIYRLFGFVVCVQFGSVYRRSSSTIPLLFCSSLYVSNWCLGRYLF